MSDNYDKLLMLYHHDYMKTVCGFSKKKYPVIRNRNGSWTWLFLGLPSQTHIVFFYGKAHNMIICNLLVRVLKTGTSLSDGFLIITIRKLCVFPHLLKK